MNRRGGLLAVFVLGVACTEVVGVMDAAEEDAGEGTFDALPADAALADLEALDSAPVDAESRDAADAGQSAPKTLQAARDRLLASEAARLSQSACERWSTMTDVERGVFLTITDLLGHRSFLEDGSSAIEHVTSVWAVRPAQSSGCVRCCGGGEYNRLYLSADGELIAAFRTLGGALTPWMLSTDPAGPHAPFDQSAMTSGGLPEGQAHYFATDAAAVSLGREGVEDVLDPHVVEIDIDYNLIHDSNPTCEYGGESGLELYERSFTSVGTASSAELDYEPSGC